MASCGVCGDQLNCGTRGCGYICTSDCLDCYGWCEPTVIEASNSDRPLMIDDAQRTFRNSEGEPATRLRGPEAADPGPAVPRYRPSTELTFDLKDVSRRSLSQALNTLLTVRVRAGLDNADERLTIAWRGSAGALMKQLSLDTDERAD